jgi:hypothetical protein
MGKSILAKPSSGILKPLLDWVAVLLASFLAGTAAAPDASGNVLQEPPSPPDIAQQRATLEARITRAGSFISMSMGAATPDDLSSGDKSVQTAQFPNWANYNFPNFGNINFPNFPNFGNAFPNFGNAFPNFPNFH